MRRQDEIRLLITSQTSANRKFLLSELDRFAQAFDADDLSDLLNEQLGVGEVSLRRQSLVTGTLFTPPYVARRHGATEEAAGVWTGFLDDAGREQALAGTAAEHATEGLRRAARERLAPLVAELATALVRLPEDVRPHAALALALSPGAHQFLPAPADRRATFATTWAWAASGGARSDPERLAAFLDRHGPGDPDLFHAALHLPPTALARLVQSVSGRVDWTGVAHLAQAAGRAGGAEALVTLDALARGAAGWGAVYVLRAIESLRKPTGLDLAKRIHAAATHEFVRQQAVRTAGSISSEASIQFCLAQLSAPEPGIVAQALESLVRVRCPKSDLTAQARALVAHADLRVRVNALLATVEPEEGRLPEEAKELLKSTDAFQRVEGAFCLGYWQSKLALAILAELAVRDASALVRTQAIKSVSRYDAQAGIPVLTRLVEIAPPAEALIAARVMARLRGQVTHLLADFFVRELVRHTDPARRALLLDALGGLAVTARDARIEGVFATALAVDDPRIAAAALAGYTLMGGPAEVDVSARLAQLEKSGGAAGGAAAVVSFLSGDLAVVDRLVAGLKAADPAAARAARALIEVASFGVGASCTGLARKLSVRAAPAARTSEPPEPPAPSAPPAAAGPVLADGEFEVRSASRTRSPASAETEQRTLQELFPEVPKRPSARFGRPEPPGQQVGKATYLVAAAERGRALEAESPAARLSRAMRQTAAFLRQNPILCAPPVALLVVAVVVLRAATAEAPPVVTKAAAGLTVMSVRGTLRVAGDPAPLGPADVVRLGETIALDPAAEARLVTPAGDEIDIHESVEIKLAAADPRGGITLAPKRGTITIRLTSAVPLELSSVGRRVGGRGVSFRCTVKPDVWVVEALTANVETADASGTATLARGARKELR